MKVWVLSDLHLDVNAAFPFVLPQERPEHDVLVVAGDICENIIKGLDWIAAERLDRKPVVYVPGNHEFYGRDIHAHLAAARAAALGHPNIHLLSRDRVSIDGVTFLGATLWTDYRLAGAAADAQAVAERLLSDHRLIETAGKVFSAADALREHEVTRAWLERELSSPRAGRRVVVTHHAPSASSISERFRGHPLSPAFGSRLDHLVETADLWVHGHTHRATRYRLGCAEVVNNPRGYVRHEQTGFEPSLVIKI